jgi:hypothetical protein
MNFSGTLFRGLAVFVAISLIQMVVGGVLPIKFTPAPHTFEWLMLVNALLAAALVVLAVRTEWRGWRLGAALAAVPLAITSLNLLEGSVFLKTSGLPWGRIFLQAAISAVLIVPVWMLLFGRRASVTGEHYHPIQAKGRGERAWKFAVSDLTYLILYYGTGMIIIPYVKDFYATQHLPSAGTIVALQLMIRGPVFVLVCLLLTRMLGLSRVGGAFTVGLLFTVISGVGPLLMPNPVFPDAVRWVHFCEVVSENFVFGAIVAWLWGEPGVAHLRELRQAA